MGRVDTPLRALIDEAWRLHHRDPLQLLSQGERIVAAASAQDDALGAAWGWLHQAWGHRFQGQRDASEAALQTAEAGFTRLQHGRGLASCRDVRVMGLSIEGRFEAAAELLALNDPRPESGRGAWERVSTLQRQGLLHTLQGDRDAALKAKYGFLAAAQEIGEPAAVAQALTAIGGEHADLFNLEEAERLCRTAMTLADEGGATHAWCMAALNGMNAIVAQGRGTEVVPWVERLLALEPSQNRRAREHRLIVYADALAQGGQLARAQAMLDESLAARNATQGHTLSWVTAQCVVWASQGHWQSLRNAAEAWLHDPQYGSGPAQVPTEQLRLLRLAARACEALGDLTVALAWERRAFELHEVLVGRSARARRLALEVEHQLASERHQRSHAEAERQRLDVLNQALEEANAAKTRFLAAASHDLRQPVQALALNMAALEIEARAAGTPAQHELVQRMAGSLQALSQMFDVLLDISRLDAGIVPVNPQPVALAPLLQRLHDELVASAAARGLRLALHLPRHAATATTTSDPVLLERCLRNLLDNALKYTARGGVLLALRPRAGGWIVQVCDSGIGMAPPVLARAHEEFFQADNPERDRARGLGLGLAIVQRMLRLLGHTLQLASRPGHGTAATLSLVAAAPIAPAPAAAVAAGGTAPGVLAVIDDDSAVRDGLAALLQRWGHAVLQGADDAALLKAWHAAGRPPVHALITDLRLSRHRTGLQAVAALRQAWGAALPALVITGDIAPERLQALRDSGLPWLAKPVMPMRLRGWIAGLQTPPADPPRTPAA
jgi:signal transduction histidine kinase/CheY-like chemotaxis protein